MGQTDVPIADHRGKFPTRVACWEFGQHVKATCQRTLVWVECVHWCVCVSVTPMSNDEHTSWLAPAAIDKSINADAHQQRLRLLVGRGAERPIVNVISDVWGKHQIRLCQEDERQRRRRLNGSLDERPESVRHDELVELTAGGCGTLRLGRVCQRKSFVFQTNGLGEVMRQALTVPFKYQNVKSETLFFFNISL